MSGSNEPGRGLTVGDVIRTQLYRIPETSTISQAATEFVRRDIECLIVEMGDGSVRLLSERALLHALLPTVDELHAADRLPDEVELEAIANEHAGRAVTTADLVDAETVAASQPAMKALALMLASNYRRLIVVDSSGELAGIVTQRDLTRTVLMNLHMSAR